MYQLRETRQLPLDTSMDVPPDEGCHIFEACLSCPLPMCVYEASSQDAGIRDAWAAGVRLPTLFDSYRGAWRHIPVDVVVENGYDPGALPVGRKLLTEEQRLSIRHRLADGEGIHSIADRLGISTNTVRYVGRPAVENHACVGEGHGKPGKYKAGCRGPLCTEANSKYTREWSAKKRAKAAAS